MVECVRAGDPAHFCVTARPNYVAGGAGLRVAMVVLLPWWGGIGAAFVKLGAWPVTLFMLLPLLGLAWAFHQVERHAGDFERLTLDDDRLVLDTHTPDADQHLEFNSHWVQVALYSTSAGGGNVLTLRSHGKEVAFGHLLSDEERTAISRELNLRLAQIKHY
ncbi:MAG: Protein of unknown function transrane [Rhodocyclaceae bacterium]|nr:Protein of unknown function transrane [Rhodocyclaceae bacterium]